MFSEKYGIELNISKGDMKKLSFDEESMGYIYSYNSIFHMTKNDIIKSVNEIKIFLKPGGICCINFLSVNDDCYGKGKELGKNEFLHIERGEELSMLTIISMKVNYILKVWIFYLKKIEF